MSAHRAAPSTTGIEAVFARYADAWAARDADGIAALHHADTTFWLRNGEPPVHGRNQVRERFATLFEQLPEFGFEPHRVLFGDEHWVMDWRLTCVLADASGVRRSLGWDCVDVVTVDPADLVLRKDTFVDAAQMTDALATLR